MKRVLKYLMMISAAAVFTLMSTGCLRQDYMFFEDGEFDGSSFSDYAADDFHFNICLHYV